MKKKEIKTRKKTMISIKYNKSKYNRTIVIKEYTAITKRTR
jgi:hypothetical protein